MCCRMKKKNKKGFIKVHGNSPKDNVLLALAFVGEHKELFSEWIESKGGKVQEEEEN